MAVSIVSFRALAEPKDFANAKRVAQPLFDFIAAQIGISVLV